MSFEPFTHVQGPATPLMQSNVDTDVIIRIERLTTLTKEQLGPYAFESLRYMTNGQEDPECALNQPIFRSAPILLAADNFGCGSSREGAVWALQGRGVRCVIAPSFGDIFFGNCFQNGVLAICLSLAKVQSLAQQCANGASIRVDLETCSLTAPDGERVDFQIDALRRDALLKGLDDVGLTLSDDPLIQAWQQSDRQLRPWAWTVERG